MAKETGKISSSISAKAIQFLHELRKEVFPTKAATVVMMALVLSAFITGNKNILGDGYQVSQVSNLIYKVEVNGLATQEVEDVRNIALLHASEKTIESGYTKFRIIGGDGFKEVRRTLQVGPIPLPIDKEPRGNITVKFLELDEASDSDTYDAAQEIRRLSSEHVQKSST